MRITDRLPLLITTCVTVALLAYGPIRQFAHYLDFADNRTWLGIPNAANVLSNLGFALIGLWGLFHLAPARRGTGLAAGWPGYCLFLVALAMTALGSGYYHWAPDEDRLVWDRLAIALACAGLLTGVRADTCASADANRWTMLLALAAVASVVWCRFAGDLRPYLLLQGLTLVLIPLWQAIDRAPAAEQRAFGLAIGLYVAAKLAELFDQQMLTALHGLSGHTLKHLLASLAAAVVVIRLVRRVDGSRQIARALAV